jgi:hypothetical protein
MLYLLLSLPPSSAAVAAVATVNAVITAYVVGRDTVRAGGGGGVQCEKRWDLEWAHNCRLCPLPLKILREEGMGGVQGCVQPVVQKRWCWRWSRLGREGGARGACARCSKWQECCEWFKRDDRVKAMRGRWCKVVVFLHGSLTAWLLLNREKAHKCLS